MSYFKDIIPETQAQDFSVSASYFNTQKLNLKVLPDNTNSHNVKIEIDDFQQRQNLLLNRNISHEQSIKNSSQLLFVHANGDNMLKLFEENIKNGMCENLENKLRFDNLPELQKEILRATDSFIYDDFKLSSGNYFNQNFLFDPLNGNFREVVYDTTTEPKEVSLGNNLDFPLKTKNTFRKNKLIDNRNPNELEGNSHFMQEQEIIEKAGAWETLIENFTSKHEIQMKEKRENDLLLELFSFKEFDLSTEKSQTKSLVHDDNHEFWKVFEKKAAENTLNIDNFQSESILHNLDFEESVRVTDLEIKLDGDKPKQQINLSEEREQFEKALEENNQNTLQLQEKKPKNLQTINQYEWAIQDNRDLNDFYEILPKNKFAMQFPFELDDFQKRAVLHLENRESVFVAAHTSAGKTVVAEYAIALSKKHMTRAVYTSPVKALSNQKYRDFSAKFNDVGILTGDVTLKPEASCLIVTTEILRSMLFKGSDTIRDIEWVIFDEVHYVNDIERGVVWEETIIMLPEHIGIIMLSATVPNAMDFANWVGRTKKRRIYVQTTYKRPTPLEHLIYFEGQTQVIKNKSGEFMQQNYENFMSRQKQKEKAHGDLREFRQKQLKEKFQENDWDFKDKKKSAHFQRKKFNAMQKATDRPEPKKLNIQKDANQFQELIQQCSKDNLLPCVFFAFSKKKCMELAYGLSSLNLTSKEEKSKITVFFNNALKRLKPVDRELPQLTKLQVILQKGIAVHHGDLLPIAKEVVEILFSDGLIKVLFATETFAMGVNMPAKTVVFCGLRKNDGKDFRYLKSNEYTQMSGRAGRRGLDEKGNVMLFVKNKNELPPIYELKKMIDQKGELLESKFRLTYGTIFSLLLAKDINVVEIMQRSFSQHGKIASLPGIEKRLKAQKKQIELIKKNMQCKIHSNTKDFSMESYLNSLNKIKEIGRELWTQNSIINNLKLPKFASFLDDNGDSHLGILIGFERIEEDIFFKIFLDVDKLNRKRKIELSYEEKYKSELRTDKETIDHMTYKIYMIQADLITQIYNDQIDSGKSSQLTYKQKEDFLWLLKKEREKLEKNHKDKDDNCYAYSIGIKNETNSSVLKLFKEMKEANKELTSHICHRCEQKYHHLNTIRRLQNLEKDVKTLSTNPLEEVLTFSSEFESRIKILQSLSYLDEKQIPLIKARVARELGSSDVFLCEVIMENILDNLSPEEVAALLSSFICQIKKSEVDYNELLPDSLKDAMQQVEDICHKIIELEVKYSITIEDEESYLTEKINFTLVKVVYEWACQKDFAEICQLTDVQEGSIVRTILRLDILLRNLKTACKVMGNMKLHKLIDEASHLIRRDIVFAGSLYLE